MHLRLNRIQYPVYNLGYGRRIAIWMQGCTLGCNGCISPSLWNSEGGKDIAVTELAAQIKSIADDYDGITFTGGEPTQQYEALMTLCSLIKRLTNLDIYLFSGYTLDELNRDHPDRMFMRLIDYLVDDRYLRELHDDNNIRGSSNQQFYQFIDGNAVEIEILKKNQKWSLTFSEDGQIFMAGIPRRDELKTLMKQSRSSGIKIKFK